jgi:hypothetical protein
MLLLLLGRRFLSRQGWLLVLRRLSQRQLPPASAALMGGGAVVVRSRSNHRSRTKRRTRIARWNHRSGSRTSRQRSNGCCLPCPPPRWSARPVVRAPATPVLLHCRQPPEPVKRIVGYIQTCTTGALVTLEQAQKADRPRFSAHRSKNSAVASTWLLQSGSGSGIGNCTVFPHGPHCGESPEVTFPGSSNLFPEAV